VNKLALLLVFISVVCGPTAIADEFQKLRCDSDIPKTLIGQRSSNQPVVVLEKKYRALGLKDLGADEISNRLSSVNWQICGAEYIMLIDRGGFIRDVLPFPAHSKSSPAFAGTCQLNGQNLPDFIVAILDGAPTTDSLGVRLAWEIDQQRAMFVQVSIEGLVCPRSGIYTVDGGR
jgi:hypothetical protein